jgi:hypothetical protein
LRSSGGSDCYSISSSQRLSRSVSAPVAACAATPSAVRVYTLSIWWQCRCHRLMFSAPESASRCVRRRMCRCGVPSSVLRESASSNVKYHFHATRSVLTRSCTAHRGAPVQVVRQRRLRGRLRNTPRFGRRHRRACRSVSNKVCLLSNYHFRKVNLPNRVSSWVFLFGQPRIVLFRQQQNGCLNPASLGRRYRGEEEHVRTWRRTSRKNALTLLCAFEPYTLSNTKPAKAAPNARHNTSVFGGRHALVKWNAAPPTLERTNNVVDGFRGVGGAGVDGVRCGRWWCCRTWRMLVVSDKRCPRGRFMTATGGSWMSRRGTLRGSCRRSCTQR